MTYIYALDLSMLSSGVAIFSKDANIVGIFCIKTNPKNTHGQRLRDIANYMSDLMVKYPVDFVVLERTFHRFNVSTAALYRVHGVINFLFSEYPQIYYSPKEIKKKILNGNATKKQVQKKIEDMYPHLIFENDDMSDAVAIGLSYFIDKEIISWEETHSKK